jgi:hypothetical protein
VPGNNQNPDTHGDLRFERVSCAQKMGFKTRHQWHNPNWKFIEEHPQEALRIMYVHIKAPKQGSQYLTSK